MSADLEKKVNELSSQVAILLDRDEKTKAQLLKIKAQKKSVKELLGRVVKLEQVQSESETLKGKSTKTTEGRKVLTHNLMSTLAKNRFDDFMPFLIKIGIISKGNVKEAVNKVVGDQSKDFSGPEKGKIMKALWDAYIKGTPELKAKADAITAAYNNFIKENPHFSKEEAPLKFDFNLVVIKDDGVKTTQTIKRDWLKDDEDGQDDLNSESSSSSEEDKKKKNKGKGKK